MPEAEAATAEPRRRGRGPDARPPRNRASPHHTSNATTTAPLQASRAAASAINPSHNSVRRALPQPMGIASAEATYPRPSTRAVCPGLFHGLKMPNYPVARQCLATLAHSHTSRSGCRLLSERARLQRSRHRALGHRNARHSTPRIRRVGGSTGSIRDEKKEAGQACAYARIFFRTTCSGKVFDRQHKKLMGGGTALLGNGSTAANLEQNRVIRHDSRGERRIALMGPGATAG